MNSIKFPDMFNTSNTNVTKTNDEATLQNFKLLLDSEKGELFGDPFYGIRLKRYVFDPNNFVLRDILIDDIYTQALVFMPQLTINRNDIKIIQEGKTLKCRIKVINNLNFKTNMFDLVLFQEEDK